MTDLETVEAFARAHPALAALVVAHLFLSALGNVRLSEEQARQYPRLASAVLLGQRLGIVGRGVVRPLLGLVLPSAAKDLIDAAYPPNPASAAPPPSNHPKEPLP